MPHLTTTRRLKFSSFIYVPCVVAVLLASLSFAEGQKDSVNIEKFELKQRSIQEYTWEATVLNRGTVQPDELTLQIFHKLRTSTDNFVPIQNGTQVFTFDAKLTLRAKSGSSADGRQIPGSDTQQQTKKLSGAYVFYHSYDRLRAKVIRNGKTIAQKDVDLPRLSIKIGTVTFSASDTPGRVKWQSSVTNEGILPIHNLSVQTSRKTSGNGSWTAMGAGSFAVPNINLKQNESVPISSYATISDVTPNDFLYFRVNVEAGEGPLTAATETKYLPPQETKSLSPVDRVKPIKK